MPVRMLFLTVLISCALPAEAQAQWTIKESEKTDVLRSRPVATGATLLSNEGHLSWEYECFQDFSGPRYLESLDLYTERDGEKFSSGTIRYRFDGGQWQRSRWVSFDWKLGLLYTNDEMRRFRGMMRRHRSLDVEVVTDSGNVTNSFDLAGTIATLNEIACPVVGNMTTEGLRAEMMAKVITPCLLNTVRNDPSLFSDMTEEVSVAFLKSETAGDIETAMSRWLPRITQMDRSERMAAYVVARRMCIDGSQ